MSTSYPISEIQKGFYYDWLSDPASTENNIPFVFHLYGKLDIDVLDQALDTYVNCCHPHAKGRFIKKNNSVAFLYPGCDMPILSRYIATHDTYHEHVKRCVEQPFDLHSGPLFRAAIYTLDVDTHIFVMVFHHIIMDASIVSDSLNKISLIYNTIESGYEYSDTPGCGNWKEYLAYEQECKANDHKLFWEKYLIGSTLETTLPGKMSTPGGERGLKIKNLILDKRTDKDIRMFLSQKKITAFQLFLACYAISLSKFCNLSEVVIGYPVNCRPKHIETPMSCYVNIIPIRIKVNPNSSIDDILLSVKADRRLSSPHQYYPGHEIIGNYRQHIKIASNKLLNVACVLSLGFNQNALSFNGISSEGGFVHAGQGGHKYDLNHSVDLELILNDTDEMFSFFLQHNPEVLDDIVADEFMEYCSVILKQYSINSQIRVGELPYFSNHAKQNAASAAPSENIIDLFHAVVGSCADRIAIKSSDMQMTFSELDSAANKLASHIRARVVDSSNNKFIAICLDRGMELIISIIATLKMGYAYVPLESTHPSERIVSILDECKPSAIISSTNILAVHSALTDKSSPLILIDKDYNTDSGSDDTYFKQDPRDGSDLAYILYTTGSTGTPKGVMVNHAGICNLSRWYIDYFQLTVEDRGSQFASFAFDTFGCELWPLLLNGCSVHIVDDITKKDPAAFVQWLKKSSITILDLPSAYAELLLENADLSSTSLRYLKVGGEKVSRLPKKTFPFDIINSYGLTETSIECLFAKIYSKYTNNTTCKNPTIPIGKPINNMCAYILDDNLQMQPTGVIGHIYIGGVGLANGYLKSDEPNQSHFIPNPFSDSDFRVLFKTNDLGRWLPDGQIDYISRSDNQVKISGMMVNLSEVENVLLDHPNVHNAVVIYTHKNKSTQLHAYIQSTHANLTVDSLFDHAAKTLPQFMLPATYYICDTFPVNKNGKIDREHLLNLGSSSKPQSHFPPSLRANEQTILGLWKEMLPNSFSDDEISNHISFFEAGGSSLALMQLMFMINERYNISISLADLLSNPSICAQADLISSMLDSAAPAKSSGIVNYNEYPISNAPTIVLIPTRGSSTEIYQDLSKSLSSHYNVICLKSYNLYANNDFIDNIVDLASYYNDILKNELNHNSYILAGLSMGGNIAYEMAQQLTESGIKVPQIVLFDSLALCDQAKQLLDKIENISDKLFRNTPCFTHLAAKTQSHILNVRAIEHDMFVRYNHSPTQQSIVLFKATNYSIPDSCSSHEHEQIKQFYAMISKYNNNGWGSLVSDVELIKIDSVHKSVVSGPQASLVADHLIRLKAFLQEVE